MPAPSNSQRLGETTKPQAVNTAANREQPIPLMLKPVMPLSKPTRLQMAARGTKIRPHVKIPNMPKTQPSNPDNTP